MKDQHLHYLVAAFLILLVMGCTRSGLDSAGEAAADDGMRARDSSSTQVILWDEVKTEAPEKNASKLLARDRRR